MRRLRLLALALIVAAVAALIAVVAGPWRADLDAALRERIARAVEAALHMPCALEALSLSLAPPQVVARGLRLGGDGAVASVGEVRVAIRARTSLRQGRPVLDVEADDVRLDLRALLDAQPPGPAAPPPPFRLRRVRVRDLRARLSGEPQPVLVTAPLVEGQATVEGGGGRMRLAVRGTGTTIERDGRRLTLARVEARASERADGWWVQRLALRGDGVALDGVERDGALRVGADLDLERLAWIDPALDAVRGAAKLDGALTGSLAAPTFEATVTVPALGVGEQALGELVVAARIDAEQVIVTSARLRGLGGTVEGAGGARFAEGMRGGARIAWHGLSLPALAGRAGVELPAAALDGEGEASGTLAPLRLAGSGAGRISPPGGAPPLRWTGRGRLADGGGGATVEIAQGDGNGASADVGIAADGALSGTVRLRIADPDALGAMAAITSLPELRGALEARATVAGTVRDPRLQGSVDGRDLAVVGVRLGAVGGAFAADRAALRLDGMRAELGGGALTARGTVALDRTATNAWTVDARGVDGDTLAALITAGGARLPIAGGRFTLAAAANGPWPRVELHGRARLDDFWLGRERIAGAEVEVRAADGGWRLDAEMGNRAAQRVSVRAAGRGAEDLNVALDCEAWTLTSLWQGEQADLGGTLRAAATLRGPAAALSGTGMVAASDLVLGGRSIGTLQIDVRADRGHWSAATAVLDGGLRFTATVRPGAGLPFALDGAWREADFARLLGAPPDLHLTSSGSLRAEGRLDAVARLGARAEIAALTLTGGPKPIVVDAPVTITCRQGRCAFTPLTVRGGDAALRIAGEAGLDGRVQLTLAGGGALSVLELIGEPIESARGTFTVDAAVNRGPLGWTLRGTVNLDKVGLDAGLPIAVTRARGRLALDGTVVRVEELQGRIGAGAFTVGGHLDLRQGPALTWTLADVGADPLPSLEVELGGQGTVSGTWDRLRVGGEVHITQLLYDRDIDLIDFLPSLNRTLSAPRPEAGREVELALVVDAPGELYVENNVTRLEARGRVAISGTARHPFLDGRVETLDGEIFLRGRSFELLDASADLRPDLGLAAALNISAESLIDTPDGTYEVGVRVTGTTLEPRVTLTSDDPALSQTDIATLIAFGQTAAQMRRDGGSISLTGVLGFGSQQVSDMLTGEAERVLPVDRIEFAPTFSTTSGTFEPQLTLGKDITDNLSASVGQTFGVAARTRVEVEYRLGPRVSVPLSWESETESEAGAFAGGVRLRYEFWRITPFTLLSGLR